MTGPSHGGTLRLDGILSYAAASDPGREAVICGGVSRTYAEVHDRARRLAGALVAMGVRHGDRVALWTSNRAEFIEVIFGVPLLGAIAVPLDHWWSGGNVLSALAQVRPTVIIVGDAQASLLAGLEPELEALGVRQVLTFDDPLSAHFLSYARLLADAEPLGEPAPVSPDEAALILFTSGSTGRSKGAVHTHRDLCATAMVMGLELGLRHGERTLHFLPMFSSCLEQLIPLTLMHATHVIMPQFDAGGVWDAVATHRITHFDAVPTTLRRVLEHLPARVPESLRLVSYASEPMPRPLLMELTDRMPGTDFIQFYGMIEQLCLTVLGPSGQTTRPATVGRPMLGAELRIVDAHGQPAHEAEPGEIFARSPSMFGGYWQDPEATALVVRDGWMRTGDIGCFDQDGFLVLSGRVKEVIKSGGLTIIPSEIEATLLSHETVREAAVVGVPDEKWGEAVHAFVVLHNGVQVPETELLAFCRTLLPGYKTPKSVHYVGDLPRTGIGKISRREVRDQFISSQSTKATV